MNELNALLTHWYNRLLLLSENCISDKRNWQNRNIKQIIGHMVDSVSNNIHRVVHLQYGQSPLQFPNYATHGNNDYWITIQNYENEDWANLLDLWKFSHLHFIHVVKNIDEQKHENMWNSGNNQLISLKEMVDDFPRHFQLHLNEIETLIDW